MLRGWAARVILMAIEIINHEVRSKFLIDSPSPVKSLQNQIDPGYIASNIYRTTSTKLLIVFYRIFYDSDLIFIEISCSFLIVELYNLYIETDFVEELVRFKTIFQNFPLEVKNTFTSLLRILKISSS
jgi:hypothetical protein